MAIVSRDPLADQRTVGDAGPEFTQVHVLRTGARFALLEAREAATGRLVVVKTTLPHAASWLHEVIDQQAAVLAPVSAHPHIRTLYQRTRLRDGRPALVLEHCPGSLADVLEHGALPAPQVAAIGVKLAGALETLHSTDVVHCNVTPATVLRSAWDEPVLAGFDDTAHIGAGKDGRPALQVTSAHTAPELMQGEPACVQSDVYGLAATLYELLAGRAAFREYAGESAATMIVRVLSGTVRPIVVPDVPLALSDLLTWAMSPEPRDRPPSPAWLAEELGRIELAEGWPRTRMVE